MNEQQLLEVELIRIDEKFPLEGYEEKGVEYIEFFPASLILIMHQKNKEKYMYYGISEVIWQDLCHSESKEIYYSTYIYGNFYETKI